MSRFTSTSANLDLHLQQSFKQDRGLGPPGKEPTRTSCPILALTKALQMAHPLVLAHFPQAIQFDLSNANRGDVEIPAHFLQCMRRAVSQSETHFQNFPFARGQLRENALQLNLYP